MIRASALERMLVIERVRRQAKYGTGEFSTPVLQELSLDGSEGPFVVTNMRHTFTVTRRSRDGIVRYAFSECSLDEEGPMITELFRVLWNLSVQHQWPTRCTSFKQGVDQMSSFGLTPKHLVVANPLLNEVCGEEFPVAEAEQLMAVQGYVTEVQGLRILSAPIPAKVGMVVAAPSTTGFYTRVDDRLGVLIKRANRSIFLVNRTADE